MEREKGFEPSTLALARRCSTTELFPLAKFEDRSVLALHRAVKIGIRNTVPENEVSSDGDITIW
jgi:hypothetical protein